MITKIPPNLKKLAELTSNSDLKIDESILTQPQQKPSPNHTPPGINLSEYILLPNHNLYIAKQRTHFSQTWFDAHKLLHQEQTRMLILPEFIDFLKLLKSGNATDGLGNKLSEQEHTNIYNELTEKKDPWRAEWLDADFKYNEQTHIYTLNTLHQTSPQGLKPLKSESLESCLMQDCYADILNPNKQGLPTKKSNSQEFYHWYPRPDHISVAWFDADSGGAILYCYGIPRYSNSALGVRKIFSTGNRG